MTVIGKAPQSKRWLPPGSPTQGQRTLSALGYLGAVLLVPIVPLAVYLAKGRTSPFVQWHAAQATNVALTALFYAISGTIMGALLAFDSPVAALAVMVPLAAVGWLVIVTYLVRGAAAAREGGFRQIPAWICSPLVK
jgi:uncharacterized Tic20 family protein